MTITLTKILFCAAILALYPCTLSAQTEDPDERYKGAVVVNKYVKDFDYGTNRGIIALESYLGGNKSDLRKSLDISLVLDTSGSMADSYPGAEIEWMPHNGVEQWKVVILPIKEYTGWSVQNFGYSAGVLGSTPNFDDEIGYYIQYPESSGNFYPVYIYNVRTKLKTGIGWNDNYRAYFRIGDDIYWLNASDGNDRFDYLTDDDIAAGKNQMSSEGLSQTSSCLFNRTLYYQKNSTKLNTLKTAAKNFIDLIAADDAAEGTLDHRISIVKFASPVYNNGEYGIDDVSLVEDNAVPFTEVVKGFYDADSYKDDLKAAIQALVSNGSTSADYGMRLAQELISTKGRTGTKKVVILFTDGEPNHQNGFDAAVANKAISISKSLKSDGADVYTVGVFGNLGTRMTNIDKYMNGVSSNYPSATGYNSLGTKEDTEFYVNASNMDLSSVFSTIAGEIMKATDLDEDSIIKDILSSSCTFPAGFKIGDIKLYTAACTAVSPSLTFADPVLVSGGDYKVTTGTTASGENYVDVTGFNLNDNWCCEVSGSPSGKKFIVEIPFSLKLTPSLMNSSEIQTNASGSGLYTDLGNYLVKSFALPKLGLKSLTIHKTGLHAGESAIFKIEIQASGSSDYVPANRIVLTGTNDNGAEVSYKVPFIDPNATYKVTEQTDWSWTYTPDVTTSGAVTQTKDMSKVTGSNFDIYFKNDKIDKSKYQKNKEVIRTE